VQPVDRLGGVVVEAEAVELARGPGRRGRSATATERYWSEPITTGRVVVDRLDVGDQAPLAIGMPAIDVEPGISLPIDHMITAGLLRAAVTISWIVGGCGWR